MTITDTDISVPQKKFPGIPSYALRSIPGDDFENFLKIDLGDDTQKLLNFLGFSRKLLARN